VELLVLHGHLLPRVPFALPEIAGSHRDLRVSADGRGEMLREIANFVRAHPGALCEDAVEEELEPLSVRVQTPLECGNPGKRRVSAPVVRRGAVVDQGIEFGEIVAERVDLEESERSVLPDPFRRSFGRRRERLGEEARIEEQPFVFVEGQAFRLFGGAVFENARRHRPVKRIQLLAQALDRDPVLRFPRVLQRGDGFDGGSGAVQKRRHFGIAVPVIEDRSHG